MKTVAILLTGFLIIFSSGCDKKQTINPDNFGEVTAKKNGEDWFANTYLSFNLRGDYSEDTITIYCENTNKDGFLRDHLSFKLIPFKVGIVEMMPYRYKRNEVSGARLSLLYGDGHVSGDIYSPIPGHSMNHFEIMEINDKIGRVKGVFELAMERDTIYGNKQDPAMPDTFYFTEGKFELYVRELIRD